jgi:hypothetical protein
VGLAFRFAGYDTRLDKTACMWKGGKKTEASQSIGRMAEWLCRGLQILVQRFDSASGLHSLNFPDNLPFRFSTHRVSM